MKRLLIFLLITCCIAQANAQFIHKIKADSVLITNDSCTAELNLENSTKHINGFLYNKGNGRTEFRKVVKLDDSTIIIGGDTLAVIGNFMNGLTRTGNTIRWGGTISSPVSLTASGTNNITIAGNTVGGSALLDVSATGNGSGIGIRFIGSSTSTGIIGSASYTGVQGVGLIGTRGISQANGGFGVEGLAFLPPSGGEIIPLKAVIQSTATGSGTKTLPGLQIERQSGASVNAGLGSSIRFSFPSYSNSGGFPTGFHNTTEMKVVATNLFGSNTDYKYEFWAMGDSTMHNLLTLHGDGNIVFPQYTGSTFNVNDSTTYKPVVMDASGNIRKFDSWTTNSSGSNAPRVSSIASSSTITPNALTDDVYAVTALAENTTIATPSGTFHDGQIIILRIKDNGTSRTISWNSIYRGGMDFSLPTSTVAGKATYITFIWNAQDSKLDGVGLSKGY